MADGADIREEGKPDEFFFGLQVNQPYNWEGGGGEGGVRNGSLWYTENESEKLIHLFPVFFGGGGGGVSRRLYRFGSWNWKW